jgi:VanZ like family
LLKLFLLPKIKPSFFPAITWLIISTVLLTIPGKSFPSQNWLSALFEKIWFDKWVHITMFIIMVALWCWAASGKKKKSNSFKNLFILIAVIWFAYGIGMEFVQRYFIPNRSFDVKDIIADGVGCVIGLLYSIRRYVPTQNLK